MGVGEALDRLSILEIKCTRLHDEQKLVWARKERLLLERKLESLVGPVRAVPAYHELITVNAQLWDVEDRLRVLDGEVFGFDTDDEESSTNEFLKMARSVYRLNDTRATIKGGVDRCYNSAMREVKSYV
jgi:hypothetical protein